MTLRILGWSDGGSACEFYRLRVPLEHMAAMDSDIKVEISGMFTKVDGEPPDVVIGQRVNMDGPTELWRMMATGEFGKRPRLVYEIDDDLFNVPASNPVFGHFNRPEIQDNIRQCMAVADVITVSTEPLAKEVKRQLSRKIGSDVRPGKVQVIPNALPSMAYRADAPSPRDPGGIVTVGWAGSSSHEEDFDEVAQPLGRFLKRNPKAKFLQIGARFPSVAKRAPAGQLDFLGWQGDIARYYQALDLFDIGIIPLRPSVFNQSKSDIKLLEYAARRVPIIASDAGPYSSHKNLAGLCNRDFTWGIKLQHMVNETLCEECHSKVEEAFKYAVNRGSFSTAVQWRSAVGL